MFIITVILDDRGCDWFRNTSCRITNLWRNSWGRLTVGCNRYNFRRNTLHLGFYLSTTERNISNVKEQKKETSRESDWLKRHSPSTAAAAVESGRSVSVGTTPGTVAADWEQSCKIFQTEKTGLQKGWRIQVLCHWWLQLWDGTLRLGPKSTPLQHHLIASQIELQLF